MVVDLQKRSEKYSLTIFNQVSCQFSDFNDLIWPKKLLYCQFTVVLTWKETPNLNHLGFASKIKTTLKNLKFIAECREIVVWIVIKLKKYIYFQTYQIVSNCV